MILNDSSETNDSSGTVLLKAGKPPFEFGGPSSTTIVELGPPNSKEPMGAPSPTPGVGLGIPFFDSEKHIANGGFSVLYVPLGGRIPKPETVTKNELPQ